MDWLAAGCTLLTFGSGLAIGAVLGFLAGAIIVIAVFNLTYSNHSD